jgi:hypothetical protein
LFDEEKKTRGRKSLVRVLLIGGASLKVKSNKTNNHSHPMFVLVLYYSVPFARGVFSVAEPAPTRIPSIT